MIDISKLEIGSKVYEIPMWGTELYRECTVTKVTAKQIKITGGYYKTTVNETDRNYFNTKTEILEEQRRSVEYQKKNAERNLATAIATLEKIDSILNGETQP